MPVRPGIAAGFPRASRSDEDRRHERVALAYRYAPVFVQDLSPQGFEPTSASRTNGRAFEDYFLRVNFDGDEDLKNNAEHLASHCRTTQPAGPCDLRGFVYYAVQETEANAAGLSHLFLHYAYYHPRDPKRFRGHAHDMEGALVVVERDSTGAERVVSVATQAHDSMPTRAAAELTLVGEVGRADVDGTHVLLRSQVGHSCGLLSSLLGRTGHGTDVATRADLDASQTLVYGPTEQDATAPSPPNRRVAYRLIALTNDLDGNGVADTDADGDDNAGSAGLGLWDRLDDARVYGASSCLRTREGVPSDLLVEPGASCTRTLAHGLQGGACGANLPWGWKLARDRKDRGGLFLEPALNAPALKLDSNPGPYLFDRRMGTTPGHVYRAALLALLHPSSTPPRPRLACLCQSATPPADASCGRGPEDLLMRCGACTPFEPRVRATVNVLRDGWLPDLGLAHCPMPEGTALAIARPLRLVLARMHNTRSGAKSLAQIEREALTSLDAIAVDSALTVTLACRETPMIDLGLSVVCRDQAGNEVPVEAPTRHADCNAAPQRVTWAAHEFACPPFEGQASAPVLLGLEERAADNVGTTTRAQPTSPARLTLYAIDGARLR